MSANDNVVTFPGQRSNPDAPSAFVSTPIVSMRVLVIYQDETRSLKMQRYIVETPVSHINDKSVRESFSNYLINNDISPLHVIWGGGDGFYSDIIEGMTWIQAPSIRYKYYDFETGEDETHLLSGEAQDNLRFIFANMSPRIGDVLQLSYLDLDNRVILAVQKDPNNLLVTVKWSRSS